MVRTLLAAPTSTPPTLRGGVRRPISETGGADAHGGRRRTPSRCCGTTSLIAARFRRTPTRSASSPRSPSAIRRSSTPTADEHARRRTGTHTHTHTQGKLELNAANTGVEPAARPAVRGRRRGVLGPRRYHAVARRGTTTWRRKRRRRACSSSRSTRRAWRLVGGDRARARGHAGARLPARRGPAEGRARATADQPLARRARGGRDQLGVVPATSQPSARATRLRAHAPPRRVVPRPTSPARPRRRGSASGPAATRRRKNAPYRRCGAFAFLLRAAGRAARRPARARATAERPNSSATRRGARRRGRARRRRRRRLRRRALRAPAAPRPTVTRAGGARRAIESTERFVELRGAGARALRRDRRRVEAQRRLERPTDGYAANRAPISGRRGCPSTRSVEWFAPPSCRHRPSGASRSEAFEVRMLHARRMRAAARQPIADPGADRSHLSKRQHYTQRARPAAIGRSAAAARGAARRERSI